MTSSNQNEAKDIILITPAQKEERRQLFEKATRDSSYDKWIAKANKIIKGYYWTIETKGLEKEIIHDIAEKIITGKRLSNWNMKKPNLDQVMYMDMKGVIYNLHKKESRKVATADEIDDDNYKGLNLEELYSSTNEEVDSEYETKEVLELLEKEFEKDDLCMEIFLGIRTNDFDIKDDKSISEVLGKDINQIRAAKKRYNRHIDKITAIFKK